MARDESLDPAEVPFVQVLQPCVRKAFLRGTGPLAGKPLE